MDARLDDVTSGDPDLESAAAVAMAAAGARFALVFGSRAGTDGPGSAARANSDLDVAAWWDGTPPDAWQVPVPAGVDLVVLNRAPLWLAGRAAMWGRPLYIADEAADLQRIDWQVDVRLRYLDELPGIRERYELRRRQLAAGATR
ncbi:MAG: nucleotidyltransferase domain-containing protein [Kineosporiaceae bacterium]